MLTATFFWPPFGDFLFLFFFFGACISIYLRFFVVKIRFLKLFPWLLCVNQENKQSIK